MCLEIDGLCKLEQKEQGKLDGARYNGPGLLGQCPRERGN